MGRTIINAVTGTETSDANFLAPDLRPPLAERLAKARMPFFMLAERLLNAGAFTPVEGLAWAETGAIPQAIRDEAQRQFDAGALTLEQFVTVLVEARQAEFARNSPFIEVLRVAYNRTPEQIDDFFLLPG